MFRKPRQSTSEEEIDEIFRQVISDNQRKNAESLNPFSLAPSDTAEDLAQVSKELAELPSKEPQTKSANEIIKDFLKPPTKESKESESSEEPEEITEENEFYFEVEKEAESKDIDDIYNEFVDSSAVTAVDLEISAQRISKKEPSILEKFIDSIASVPKELKTIPESFDIDQKDEPEKPIIVPMPEPPKPAAEMIDLSALALSLIIQMKESGVQIGYFNRNDTDIHGVTYMAQLFGRKDSILGIEIASILRAFAPLGKSFEVSCKDYINPHQFPVSIVEDSDCHFKIDMPKDRLPLSSSSNFALLQDDEFLVFIKNEGIRASIHIYQK